MKTPLTSGICINKAKDDDGAVCYEWLFDLNGESFGGYGRTVADARSDAEIVLKDAITDAGFDEAGTPA